MEILPEIQSMIPGEMSIVHWEHPQKRIWMAIQLLLISYPVPLVLVIVLTGNEYVSIFHLSLLVELVLL